MTQVSQRYLLGAYIRPFLSHSILFTKSKYRLIKKPRRLAHIPFTTAKKSKVFKIKAHYDQLPLKRADRISHPLASETVKDVTEMIKGLDVKDSFKTKGKKFFPRKDYTPYVTYVDCRDQGGPSSGPGLLSSSNDGE